MAAASGFLSEDQFLCPICLEVFSQPVTIPCGHNFCRSCITQHWDMTAQNQCPLCNHVHDRRPELHVNTFISEMAAQFTRVQEETSSDQRCSTRGEVLCDVCTGTKEEALRSCQVCLTSYCETHLEPHQRIHSLRRHKLINPVGNLENRMCRKHDRPLEVFCRTDQMFLCQFCTETNHKSHDYGSLREEYEIQKAELEKTEVEGQQMIQERRLKIEQIQQSVKLSREDADKETAENMKVFTDLIRSMERSLDQILKMIEEKQKTTEKRAEGLITELEEEISELIKRRSEVEQLSHTEDHLQFLQTFRTLDPVPPTRDWTEVRVQPSHLGSLRNAVVQLEETFNKQMEKLSAAVDMKKIQQFAADVTLDPETAHAALNLSEDRKQVTCGDVEKDLPDNPRRFSCNPCVLGKQSISSGRFYYEVQVKGKTLWDLGVALESINRKGQILCSPASGLWAIWLRNGNQYRALAGPSVLLALRSQPQTVGVLVDYEEGLVSFYDVDAAALIYSFTGCSFTGKLLPFFGPCTNDGGKNSAPLTISPVNHTD